MAAQQQKPLTAPGKIPVLSILQPWASLVVKGIKYYETRSFATKHRGPLLIHASQKLAETQRWKFTEALGTLDNRKELALGSIIGVVNVIDCIGSEKAVDRLRAERNHFELVAGDYSENRFAWCLENPIEFKTPIPWKGSLGIWNAATVQDPTKLLELELRIVGNRSESPDIYRGLLLDLRNAYEDTRHPQVFPNSQPNAQ